ncbi:MAG: hypothetical protein IRY86_13795 [Thermorudis peleae]|nr:hypothetical protein [Thermorudis peleae]
MASHTWPGTSTRIWRWTPRTKMKHFAEHQEYVRRWRKWVMDFELITVGYYTDSADYWSRTVIITMPDGTVVTVPGQLAKQIRDAFRNAKITISTKNHSFDNNS